MKNLEEFLEVHYDVSVVLEKLSDLDSDKQPLFFNNYFFNYGTGGLYVLAKAWTESFMYIHEDVIWGEDADYNDTFEEFIKEQIKHKHNFEF